MPLSKASANAHHRNTTSAFNSSHVILILKYLVSYDEALETHFSSKLGLIVDPKKKLKLVNILI